MNPEYLSLEETKQLVMAYVDGNGPSTDEQIGRWIEWCQQTRIHSAVVELCIRGELVARDPEDGSEDNWLWSKAKTDT